MLTNGDRAVDFMLPLPCIGGARPFRLRHARGNGYEIPLTAAAIVAGLKRAAHTDTFVSNLTAVRFIAGMVSWVLETRPRRADRTVRPRRARRARVRRPRSSAHRRPSAKRSPRVGDRDRPVPRAMREGDRRLRTSVLAANVDAIPMNPISRIRPDCDSLPVPGSDLAPHTPSH